MLIRYIKEKFKNLKELLGNPDNTFCVKKDDIFLVSYPKSGNTWMRFLIANLFSVKDVALDNLDQFMPSIYVAKRSDLKPNLPITIFKTHSYYKSKYAKHKVIYMTRDVRDVVVSYYHYKRRSPKYKYSSFDVFFEDFISGKVDKFGTWGNHVNSWNNNYRKNKENFLLIKYEDLLDYPQRELKKVTKFLSLNYSDQDISRAVENSTLKKLKEKEKTSADKTKKIAVDPNMPFFRKGKKMQWIGVMSEVQLKRIEKEFGGAMRCLKYL